MCDISIAKGERDEEGDDRSAACAAGGCQEGREWRTPWIYEPKGPGCPGVRFKENVEVQGSLELVQEKVGFFFKLGCTS